MCCCFFPSSSIPYPTFSPLYDYEDKYGFLTRRPLSPVNTSRANSVLRGSVWWLVSLYQIERNKALPLVTAFSN